MNPSPMECPQADLLVVDDEPRNCRLLEEYLLEAGHRVRIATEGRQALAMALERPPDVVLLDVMMPDMSGLDVCRELKAHPATRLTQVMLVTALDGTSNRVHGLDCGAEDYVCKPVRREEFLAKVRSLLRARRLIGQLEEARAALAGRTAELEELHALKEMLAQTLVHDLKNPLHAVVGNLQLIEQGADERTSRLAGRAREAAWRMNGMILDLLDVAGLEERRLALDPTPVDVVSIVHEAAEEAAGAAQMKGVRVEAGPAAEGCIARADASVLRRVVDNLLSNGVDHTPEGGMVTVSTRREGDIVVIDVVDQGPGIPPEYRERIFEKYARLALKKAGVSGNRGLGLTFCRMAVEAHGGSIGVEDAPGGGALFRTALPAFTTLQQEESQQVAMADRR